MHRQFQWTVPLRRAALWAALLGAYSCLPLLKAHLFGVRHHEASSELVAIMSVVLVLFIGFRINTAYDRWWEARKLWGTLVNVSRNLAVKIRELHHPSLTERQQARDLIVAFCVGLKDHLRDEPDLRRLPGFATDSGSPTHMPSYIVRRLYRLFEQWRSAGSMTDVQLWVFDVESRSLLDVCGACERIKNTRVSISWRFFTWQVITLSLLAVPWGLAEEFGWLTIPFTILISYFVIAGESIARRVEAPFGREEDQLALESMCETIDRSVSEILLDDTPA